MRGDSEGWKPGKISGIGSFLIVTGLSLPRPQVSIHLPYVVTLDPSSRWGSCRDPKASAKSTISLMVRLLTATGFAQFYVVATRGTILLDKTSNNAQAR